MFAILFVINKNRTFDLSLRFAVVRVVVEFLQVCKTWIQLVSEYPSCAQLTSLGTVILSDILASWLLAEQFS